MSRTTKTIDNGDSNQVLGYSFNPVDNSLTTGSFLVAMVGREVRRADTAPGDLNGKAAGDDFSFYENSVLLYVIRILYNDAGKTDIYNAKRVA